MWTAVAGIAPWSCEWVVGSSQAWGYDFCEVCFVWQPWCYGLGIKCPLKGSGVGDLIPSWWHYFRRWALERRLGHWGRSLGVSCPWSLPAFPLLPVHHEVKFLCHRGVLPDHIGPSRHGLSPQKPWAKKPFLFVMFLSGILSQWQEK
jgi:hypothetical protein